MSEQSYVKISELRPGMNKISLRLRVLEAGEPKTVQTRRGPRTLSEALVGDETGRTRLTLWGNAASSVSSGDAIEVRGAWTTVYRGQVVLNVGGSDNVVKVDDTVVPQADEIPEDVPRAPPDYKPQRPGFGGSSFRPGRRGFGRRPRQGYSF
ncbi:MAG: single-stranded DNA-binding protein [Thermoproteota archaeon]